ncbi:MAG TPA: hypothetical protein DDZ41_10150, partial [Flavobacterium sp.]|nr:hypothetical protein [Flavobacterium sp.]
MLIGADLFFELLSDGQIKLGSELPILQKTQLGWIISGKINNSTPPELHCNLAQLNSNDHPNKVLNRFRETEYNFEKIDIDSHSCDRHFKSHTDRHLRDIDSKFVVSLLVNQSSFQLGNSSTRRFINLESRFKRDEELRKQYHEFIAEFICLNHMFNKSQPSKINYIYLPRYCVLKPDSSTSSLRATFDDSVNSTNRNSINSLLYNGRPVVQNELSNILLRFRTYKIAISADISRIYRQTILHQDDQKACFRIKVSHSKYSNTIYKRFVISEAARIYDPIGLVSPV